MGTNSNTEHVKVLIADGTYEIPCFSQESVSIGLSNKTFGDPTSGTLTFRGKVSGEAKFQDINDVNSIDLAAYAGVTIDSASVGRLEVTTSGIAGTGLTDHIYLAITRFDYKV